MITFWVWLRVEGRTIPAVKSDNTEIKEVLLSNPSSISRTGYFLNLKLYPFAVCETLNVIPSFSSNCQHHPLANDATNRGFI
jgi:hypothetical protein